MKEELRDALEPAERVLWEGRPKHGLMFQPSDRAAIPFTVVWCGLAFYGLLHGWRVAASPGQLLFAGGFTVIGLYLMVGRFIVDAFARAQTLYAVTDRRVIIICGLIERTVHAISLPGLAEIALTKGAAGGGTITFDRAAVSTGGGFPYVGAIRVPSLVFEGIEDVAEVLKIIRYARSIHGAAN